MVATRRQRGSTGGEEATLVTPEKPRARGRKAARGNASKDNSPAEATLSEKKLAQTDSQADPEPAHDEGVGEAETHVDDKIQDSPVKSAQKSPKQSPAASPKQAPAASPEKSPAKSPARSPAKSPARSPAKSPVKAAALVPADTDTDADAATAVPPAHHVDFEFGGPIGVVFVMASLPVVILGLFFVCNKDRCLNMDVAAFDLDAFVASLPTHYEQLFSYEAAVMFLGWMAFNVFLERFLPADSVEGVTLSTGKRLSYVISGHLQFWVTLAVLLFGFPTFTETSAAGVEPWYKTYVLSGVQMAPLELIYDHYVQLAATSIVFSTVLSVYLYAKSFSTGALLAKGGDTGYVTYDFFIGRELNPRIGNFDLKEFCELRPGLIGWIVINLGMMVKQQQTVGHISLSMLAICFSQGLYVWDALYQEKAILTTMDITTDGFGFMLAFGDLAWVPFIYSLQTRYLVDRDPNLSLLHVALFLGVQFLGYFIFRSANSQKDSFRRDPTSKEVEHLTFLETKRGTKLITSGWWGAARKINYTGDWLITLSWCLLCGFDSPIPYFQAVYFLILLVHRAIRDDAMCAEKYGADWDEYKRRVPYMFVPFLV